MSDFRKLLSAINKILKNEDDELEKKLEEEGFILPKETVECANDTGDELAKILMEERDNILAELENKDIETILDEILPIQFLESATSEAVALLFQETMTSLMTQLTADYLSLIDPEASFSYFCDRTTDWIAEWSQELGNLMHLSSHNNLQRILANALEKGESVDKTMRKLIDSYGFSETRARATALTELLTAHSYAKQEAINQSPVIDRKEWLHTGSHKNNPRPHHEALSHTIVGKKEKFTISAPTGTYQCDFPRDTTLPASERVSCHCTHRGVANDDIMGLTVEERRELQQRAIDEDNGLWKQELIERNKARAGIDENSIDLDWLTAKPTNEQISYLGGVKGKWALVESGIIQDDSQLENLYKTVTVNETKKKTLKTIDELQNDGILVVKQTTINHSALGDYNTKKLLKGGGHSQEAFLALGDVEVSHTFPNGVRVGSTASHRSSNKRTGSNLSWFPEDWTADDILVAGTITANKPTLIEVMQNNEGVVSGAHYYHEHNGVVVTVFVGTDGEVKTIFPDKDQRKLGEHDG